VAAEVVDDDDVSGSGGGDKELFDIGEEVLNVDRPVADARGVDVVITQGGKEGPWTLTRALGFI